jgi:hypothetical protein
MMNAATKHQSAKQSSRFEFNSCSLSKKNQRLIIAPGFIEDAVRVETTLKGADDVAYEDDDDNENDTREVAEDAGSFGLVLTPAFFLTST